MADPQVREIANSMAEAFAESFEERFRVLVAEMKTANEQRFLRIESKLSERVVFKDVYDAEKKAIEQAIAAEASTRATADEAAEKRINKIESSRQALSIAVVIAYLALIGALIMFAVEKAT